MSVSEARPFDQLTDVPRQLLSATTLLKDAFGTSKPLVEWNAGTVAEVAFDRYKTLGAYVEEQDREGAVKWLKDARWKKTGEAMARGTEVHQAAEAYALGTVPEVAESVLPYVEQYRRFLEDFKPEFLLAEAPVYNLSRGYAGTLDAVAVVQGATVVLDIKTTPYGPNSGRSRPPYPEVALQLCLYARAELVGVLAERKEINYRRYYAYDPETMHTEPMPEVEGAVCVVISPEDYKPHPIKIGKEVWHYAQVAIEAARWTNEVSKTVVGEELRP